MQALFKSIGLFSCVVCLVFLVAGQTECLAKAPDTAMKAEQDTPGTPAGAAQRQDAPAKIRRAGVEETRKLVKASHSVEIPLNGAQIIRIDAQAGRLEIKGTAGVDIIQASGKASALSPALLEGIRLSASRKKDTILIRGEVPGEIPMAKMDVPDMRNLDRGRFHGRPPLPEEPDAFLDLSVTVPQNVPLEVSTVWGDVIVNGTASLTLTVNRGNIRLTDLSGDLRLSVANGEIQIERVAGDVDITKGIGEGLVNTVGGSVTVHKNPFGEMRIINVKKNVRIVSDGIGDIVVESVGGDLIVEDDAGGSIRRKEIQGKVQVPEPGPPRHVREELEKRKKTENKID